MEDVPVEWETDVETTLLGLIAMVGNIPRSWILSAIFHLNGSRTLGEWAVPEENREAHHGPGMSYCVRKVVSQNGNMPKDQPQAW